MLDYYWLMPIKYDTEHLMYKCHGWYAYRLKSKLVLHGTGPLACLSLFPVAGLDKVS